MERYLEIFDEVQRSASSHKGCAKRLQALMASQAVAREMLGEILLRGVVDRLLVCSKKEPTVERVVKFYSEFVALSTDTALFVETIEHLLRRSTAADKTVRWRACQMIAGIFSQLRGEAEISDILWSSVISALTPRLKDKAPLVRAWAVKAVHKFQNPQDDNDVMMNEVMRLMNSDTSKEVRVAATETICICKATLQSLVDRIKDVKSEVRIVALQHLAKEVDVRHLTSNQRALIVRFGLNDRDQAVVKATREILLRWLDRSALDNRVHKLLKLISLKNHEEEAELVGLTIMDEVEGSANNSDAGDGNCNNGVTSALRLAVKQQCPDWQGGFKTISASEILWALLRCEYASAHFNPAAAAVVKDSLIPDTVRLCELLEQAQGQDISGSAQHQLTVKYLLRMTSFTDASDVSGKQQLLSICERMMFDITLPDALVEPVLNAWYRGSGTSLSQGVEKMLQLSKEVASRAAGPQTPEDTAVLSSARSLLMIEWSVQRLTGKKMASAAPGLFEEAAKYTLEALQQPVIELRGLAIRCLGLLSLFSEDFCGRYSDIILQVARTDLEDEFVRCQALQSIVDMATVYAAHYKDDAAVTNLLLRLQESAEPSLQKVAIESAAKLLFVGRLSESRLFANLLKYFIFPDLMNNSDEEAGEQDEEGAETSLDSTMRLQQMLSVFFQAYFGMGEEREGIALNATSALVADIAMMVRHGEIEASCIAKVSSYLLSICDTIGKSNSSSVGKLRSQFSIRLFASISREIMKFGKSRNEKAGVKEFMKVITSIDLEECLDGDFAPQALQVIMTVMKCEQLDKAAMKTLEKSALYCHTTMVKGGTSLPPPASEEESEGATMDPDSSAVEPPAPLSTATSFYALAPGLADLTDEDVLFLPLDSKDGAALPKKRAARKVKKEESESEEDEDDEEGDDEEEGNEEDSENVGNEVLHLPASDTPPKATFRAAANRHITFNV